MCPSRQCLFCSLKNIYNNTSLAPTGAPDPAHAEELPHHTAVGTAALLEGIATPSQTRRRSVSGV